MTESSKLDAIKKIEELAIREGQTADANAELGLKDVAANNLETAHCLVLAATYLKNLYGNLNDEGMKETSNNALAGKYDALLKKLPVDTDPKILKHLHRLRDQMKARHAGGIRWARFPDMVTFEAYKKMLS